MTRKRSWKREQGKRCSLMPGECFTSRAAANEMRVTRQINVATGGMVQANYHVEKCVCGRWHLMTDEHFRQWQEGRENA